MVMKPSLPDSPQRQPAGNLPANAATETQYPTAISRLPGFRLAASDKTPVQFEMRGEMAAGR